MKATAKKPLRQVRKAKKPAPTKKAPKKPSALSFLRSQVARLEIQFGDRLIDCETREENILNRLGKLDGGEGSLSDYCNHLNEVLADVMSFPGMNGWVNKREQERLEHAKRTLRRERRRERELSRLEQGANG